MEIMERLKAVTPGVPVQELSIVRNIMGQLGFHVQPDGIVTLVESTGQARQAGLKQYSRLVRALLVFKLHKHVDFPPSDFFKSLWLIDF